MTPQDPALPHERSAESVSPPSAAFVRYVWAMGHCLMCLGGIALIPAFFIPGLVSLFLAIMVCTMGGMLAWTASRHVSLFDPADVDADPAALGTPVFAGIARLLELLGAAMLTVIQITMKVFASLVAGVGAGLVTAGIFALQQPAQWDMGAMNRVGPPFGPLMLGAGVALLTGFALMVLLFSRQWFRGRKPV